jgi:hypothetical protein
MVRLLWMAWWISLSSMPDTAQASGAYYEAGTSLGGFAAADPFFNQTAAAATSSGFVGSLSVYVPVSKPNAFGRLQAGLQTRISTSTIEGTTDSLAMGSLHLGARLEIWRFYVGAGYSPFTWVSKPQQGVTSLHLNPGFSSYMGEAGLIWRVIPEFQIAACFGVEYGLGRGGIQSPLPVTEYGLRFRFPFNPKEGNSGSGVDFDGFRYPFGVMK